MVPQLSTGGLAVAGAAGPPPPIAVYNSIPSAVPGNVASVGFEANQASELGDIVDLAGGTGGSLTQARVLMSSWACGTSGSWNTSDCVTTPGSTFAQPITLNLYAVSGSSPTRVPAGSPLFSTTQTFNIPFRPSADGANCLGANAGKWYSVSDATCYNGFATPITFSLPNVTVPAQVMWTVAFNTSDYGAAPQRPQACNLTSQGCPYDSLNVGAETIGSTVGTDDLPGAIVWNTSTAGNYCDGGTAGFGVLREDDGTATSCSWAPNRPMAELDVTQTVSVPSAMPIGEGNTGGTPFTILNIPVTLSHPAVGQVTVDWTTANGTALYTSDYIKTKGTLSIPNGASSGNIAVSIRGDLIVENNETFTLTLSNPTNTTLGNTTTIVTILNDDVKLVVNGATASEGGSIPFQVSLVKPVTSGPVTLQYATVDDTAFAPGDYIAESGQIVVPTGQTGPFPIPPVQTNKDGIHETAERFKMQVSGPNTVVTTFGNIKANQT